MSRLSCVILYIFFLSSVCYAAPGDKIFYEDFSSYGEGELPAGWIGGDKLGVIEVNKKRMLRYFANGSYDVTTKKIDLSGNFKATILMKHYFHNKYKEYGPGNSDYRKQRENTIGIHFGSYQIGIGDGELIAGMKDKWSDWTEIETVAPEKTFSISLERKGAVCIVYVNNAKVFVGRFPDVKMSDIRFTSTSNSKFEIHSIVVEEL